MDTEKTIKDDTTEESRLENLKDNTAYPDSMLERAFLSEGDWSYINKGERIYVNKMRDADQKDILRRKKKLKYSKSVKQEKNLLKEEFESTGRKLLLRKAKRRLAVITGELAPNTFKSIRALLDDSPFFFISYRVEEGEAVIQCSDKKEVEEVFADYSGRVEITPFSSDNLLSIWTGHRMKVTGDFDEDTIRQLLDGSSLIFQKFRILRSRIVVELKHMVQLDDPEFELNTILSDYRDILQVASDKAYIEKWNKLISDEIENIDYSNLSHMQAIEKITDVFYRLDTVIDYGEEDQVNEEETSSETID